MKEFTSKEVKRSLRNFQAASDDVLNSGSNTCVSNIKSLMKLIKEDQIINYIVDPLLKLKLDFNKILKRSFDHWVELNLPTEKDKKIAFVIQIFDGISKDTIDIEEFSFQIFRDTHYDTDIQKFMYEVVRPSMRDLQYELGDLIEDEIQGKESVHESALQIFNFGEITADHGNVGIGLGITQTISIESSSDEIVSKALANKIIDESRKNEVKEITSSVIKELKQQKPSKNKLATFVEELYQIGKKGLISLTVNVLNNQAWSDAVTTYLLSII